ncbi:uncharacterized protein EV420DRAFT_1190859 [Desarmillaria tabescens]|uniref:Uncharacterized protein n=1 Tax=Armillaria tabescens TaxID=1929756 RepID=A0AA39NBB5_ARMTA|nr:uncharacterized protein EV420DRAFT_1190859 [Desarmillaria tabescens]KAK0462490.1 hypothetical protein EV420DRAFT_1190859 [Desarmillaria tabescens]
MGILALWKLLKGEAAEVDFKWQDQYSDIVEVNDIALATCQVANSHIIMQEDRLLVSDPKALQYIYQTSGYRVIKPPGLRKLDD